MKKKNAFFLQVVDSRRKKKLPPSLLFCEGNHKATSTAATAQSVFIQTDRKSVV